ncbi:HNH endonuclease family protein [Corynebacterium macclintockiae]|uniref:HNH endonuclease family protein n=1 Tax=Corynebacterium macclintockiae TaxID=2913501 RepID=UPI003EB9DE83
MSKRVNGRAVGVRVVGARGVAALVLGASLLLGGCAEGAEILEGGSSASQNSETTVEPITETAPEQPEQPEQPAPKQPQPPATPERSLHQQNVLDLLETLAVKGRAPKTGYSRAEFGQRWKDIDRNGCDQRNDILARDLTNVYAPKGCKVLSGDLDDPYTGQLIHFVRGQKTSQAVQIDHVVALADAWQKGAQQLSPERREQFANDPLNLLAVDGPSNMQKGAGDAATWLPANKSFRCTYVSIQVRVKAEYQLWVTQAEKEAIQRELGRC